MHFKTFETWHKQNCDICEIFGLFLSTQIRSLSMYIVHSLLAANKTCALTNCSNWSTTKYMSNPHLIIWKKFLERNLFLNKLPFIVYDGQRGVVDSPRVLNYVPRVWSSVNRIWRTVGYKCAGWCWFDRLRWFFYWNLYIQENITALIVQTFIAPDP